MTWSGQDIHRALLDLGVEAGDVLFLHSSLALCGLPIDGRPAACVIDGLLQDASHTVVLPAFTYSFGSGEAFDPNQPPAQAMGAVSLEAFHRTFLRSMDPMFSVLAHGPRAEELIGNLPARSFGEGSLFHRLLLSGVKVLTLNLNAGATLAHQWEHEVGVPHRFEKTFSGLVIGESTQKTVRWTSYVRDLARVGTEQDFGRLTGLLTELTLYRRVSVGRGQLGMWDSRRVGPVVKEALHADPNFMTIAGRKSI